MTQYDEKHVAEVMRKAKELLKAAERQREEIDARFRALGIDRQQLCAMLEAQMTDEERAEARALFEADMATVRRQVDAEMTRQRFARQGTVCKLPMRQRLMV